MIEEAYVSFETAKLLKDKGFDERLLTFYITDEMKEEGCFQIMAFTDDKIDNSHSDYCYLAPTLQMAMKWLREVHKAFISITYENDGVFTANLKVPLKGIDCMIDNKHNCWFTYEEAVEVSIKYCLENLI